MTTVMTNEESIKIQINEFEVASFVDCGNGMEGEIFEGDNSRMSASDLIAIARFILEKAQERAESVE